MDSRLEDLEQGKENVLPLRSGRKLSALQAASAEGMRDQQKRAFEAELRLYNGDDELDVWYRYVQWIEQNFPKGGQDGNLPVLLKQCISRFKNDVKYKNDERYVQCWLKYMRYSPRILELFMQMDALEIGHKSAAFYEAWSWHLEQLGNFRKASQLLQEGIDNNAQPLEVLLESQKQLSRKFVKQYSGSNSDSQEQQAESRSVLGGLKPVGKRNAAPIARGLNSKLDGPTSHPMSHKPLVPSQNSRISVLQDAENVPPAIPRTLPTSAPSEIWDSENQSKPKQWNNVKLKCTSSKLNSVPQKAEFTVHEDNNGPPEYGRKLVNCVTTVFRGSQAEIKTGFIEPDEPNKVYVCDFQKIYCGAEEFQIEEIAAARWYRDQKRKKEEQEVIKMKEELQKLKLLTATANRPIQENVLYNKEIEKKQVQRRQTDLLLQQKENAENIPANHAELHSPRTEVSSPTRDVIALWNGTLSIPNHVEISNASESSAHVISKPTYYQEEKKLGFQIYSDDENAKPKACQVQQHFINTGHKNEEVRTGLVDDCKENNAPSGFIQDIHERASPHNILQPTDRPISFGIEDDVEDDDFDDDLGVHPLPEEECHTVGPLTSELHFALGAKLASTPLHPAVPFKPASRSSKDTLCTKDVTEFKTPCATANVGLSPITEASREISKCSSACTTTSSSGSSLASSTRRCTTFAKSLLCPSTCVDPYDPDLLCSLLQSAHVEKRMGFLRIESNAQKIHKGQILTYGEHTISILGQLAEGGEGKVFRAEVVEGMNWPKEVAVKSYRPSSLWEFYICSEMKSRVGIVSGKPDVRQSLPVVLQTAVYNNCNYMISEFCPNGTLLDFTNSYRKQMQTIPETIALYFTWEILQIVSRLHDCQFVHGDIKPDNFSLLTLPTDPKTMTFTNTFCLRLIDFGRSIDLSVFPKGTTFTGCAKTANFVCPEMQENRPWIFQSDYFGILGTIHTLLFPEYMEVNKIDGSWMIKNKFKRYWQIDFWQKLFHTFLNIPDCDSFPDLSVLISELEQKLRNRSSDIDRDRYKLMHYLKSQTNFS